MCYENKQILCWVLYSNRWIKADIIQDLPRPKTLYVNCKIVGSLLQCKEAAMRPSSWTMTWCRSAGYINTQGPEATIVVDAVHNYIGNAVSIQLCSKIEVEAAEKLMWTLYYDAVGLHSHCYLQRPKPWNFFGKKMERLHPKIVDMTVSMQYA